MRTVKKPDERRKEILETAMLLFSNKGYENTLVEDITQKLQIAKGSFYYYFKSKQEVFEACMVLIAEKTVEKYMTILNNKEISVVERLKSYIAYNFEVSLKEQNKPLFETIHSPTFEGIHSRVVAESTQKLIQTFASIVEEGVASGVFESDDPEITAAALLGALSGIHELLSRRSSDSSDKHRTQVHAILRQVLGAKSNIFET